MTELDLIEQHSSELWRGERALEAIAEIAQADGMLPAGRKARYLDSLTTENLSCLIDVVVAYLALHRGLLDDAVQRAKRAAAQPC